MYQKKRNASSLRTGCGNSTVQIYRSHLRWELKTQQMSETAAYNCQFWFCSESPYANKWCVKRINFYNTNVFISGFSIEYIYIWLYNNYIYISKCLQADLPGPLSLDAFNSIHYRLLENRASCSRPTRTSSMKLPKGRPNFQGKPVQRCSTCFCWVIFGKIEVLWNIKKFTQWESRLLQYLHSPVNSRCPSPCFCSGHLRELRAGRFKQAAPCACTTGST